MPLRILRRGIFLMIVFNRRSFSIAATVIFAAGLAACGDPEPEQRKAFMAFLQGMIDRPGVHIMNPKADDDKTFGDYTKHYAVILDFNKGMKTVSEQFGEKLKQIGADRATERSIEQLVEHRSDLVAVGDAAGKMKSAIEAQLATADAQHAALKQPDDLKKVYDIAFDKLVTQPARGAAKIESVLVDGVKASLQLVDYIIANRPKVTVSGSQIRANDAKTLNEVNELLKGHTAAGAKFAEATRDMHRIVDGN